MAESFETEMLLELNRIMLQKEIISEQRYRRARELLLAELCRLRSEVRDDAR